MTKRDAGDVAERSRPAPLNRDRVLREAVALADASGVESVSMRKLSRRLGVVPMALYKHVADKEDLLAGMVDRIVESYDPPGDDPDWKAAVRGRILSARRALLRHPWVRPVIETRRKRTPAVLAYMDSLSGMLMAGGLSANLTHYAMHALGYRIWGFSPEAFPDPGALALPDDPEEREAMLRQAGATYPHILAIAEDASGGDLTVADPSCDEQHEFEFALDLLLDAFEHLHRAGWTSRGGVGDTEG